MSSHGAPQVTSLKCGNNSLVHALQKRCRVLCQKHDKNVVSHVIDVQRMTRVVIKDEQGSVCAIPRMDVKLGLPVVDVKEE